MWRNAEPCDDVAVLSCFVKCDAFSIHVCNSSNCNSLSPSLSYKLIIFLASSIVGGSVATNLSCLLISIIHTNNSLSSIASSWTLLPLPLLIVVVLYRSKYNCKLFLFNLGKSTPSCTPFGWRTSILLLFVCFTCSFDCKLSNGLVGSKQDRTINSINRFALRAVSDFFANSFRSFAVNLEALTNHCSISMYSINLFFLISCVPIILATSSKVGGSSFTWFISNIHVNNSSSSRPAPLSDQSYWA